MRAPPEYFLARPRPPTVLAHPARLILILSLAPSVGLGIGRFAYSLVLPDMRDSARLVLFRGRLHEHHQCGRLSRRRVDRRRGRSGASDLSASGALGNAGRAARRWRCARMSGNFIVLSFARLLAGIGAAVGFVAGGALAATIAQSRPERANFLLSLFYAGPGARHSFVRPDRAVRAAVLSARARGGSCGVAMTLLSLVMTVPLFARAARAIAATDRNAVAEPLRDCAGVDLSRRLLPVRRRLYRLHDLHDRLCARRRRRRGGAERVLEPDRRQRVRDAMGLARVCWRSTAAASAPRSFSASTLSARRLPLLRPFAAVAGDFGAGVRRRVFRGGGLDHRLRALQLSARGMADRDRGDDDFVRHRPDAWARSWSARSPTRWAACPMRSMFPRRCWRSARSLSAFQRKLESASRDRSVSLTPMATHRSHRTSTPAERIVTLVFPVAALVVVGDFHRDHVFRVLEAELGRHPDLHRDSRRRAAGSRRRT